MKILLLTPDIPYPTASGAAIRNYGIIRSLADIGHELTLLTFADADVDPTSNPLYQLCETVQIIPLPTRSKIERILNLFTSSKADIEFRLASHMFKQALVELLNHNSFDVIQFSGIELGCYLNVIQQHRGKAKVIYDALNAEAELQRVIANIDRRNIKRLPSAIYSYIQTRRIQGFERRLCQEVDWVFAVSQEDKDFLLQYQGVPIELMSNGIFVDEYMPSVKRYRKTNQIVYTGKMDYRPNVDAIEWFAKSILPEVRKQSPSAELTIVGRNPHPHIGSLASKQYITITGWVDSVQPYLHSATLFVVPLRMGSGTRLKILEAMASGCAIVSTSIGAAGLNQEVKQAIKIADTDAEFIQSVVSLLDDSQLRQQMGDNAIQLVRKYYDWSALIPRLLDAYRNIGLG